MSVESKRNGALRLRCNALDCPHRFIPIRDFTDARELRKRAALYGWTSAAEQDFCPADVRRAPPSLPGVR